VYFFVKIIQVTLHNHCHWVETQLQLMHIIPLYFRLISPSIEEKCARKARLNCTTEISQYLAATGGTGVAYFGKGVSDLY
jgi:hypothetical protein